MTAVSTVKLGDAVIDQPYAVKLRIDEKTRSDPPVERRAVADRLEFRVDQPGRYAVRVETSGTRSTALAARSVGQVEQNELAATGDNAIFTEQTLGTVVFDASGVQRLQLEPVPGQWGLTGLRRVALVPVDR